MQATCTYMRKRLHSHEYMINTRRLLRTTIGAADSHPLSATFRIASVQCKSTSPGNSTAIDTMMEVFACQNSFAGSNGHGQMNDSSRRVKVTTKRSLSRNHGSCLTPDKQQGLHLTPTTSTLEMQTLCRKNHRFV